MGSMLWASRSSKFLAWVGGLPVEDFEEVVEGFSYDLAKQRADPVDPVVSWEGLVDHGGTEGSHWVDSGTGVVHT